MVLLCIAIKQKCEPCHHSLVPAQPFFFSASWAGPARGPNEVRHGRMGTWIHETLVVSQLRSWSTIGPEIYHDSVTTRNVEHVCKLAPSLAFEESLHTSTVQILVHTRIYYGYTMDILWIYYGYRYTFTFVSCLIMTVVRVSWARPTAGRALRLALFWRHRCLMLLGTSCHPSLRPCWVWIGVSFGGFEHTWKCCCTWLDQTLMKHRSKAFPA